MLPALWIAVRAYAPYVTFPAAAVVGFIGYKLEGWISNRSTPNRGITIGEERSERQLEEVVEKDCTQVNSLKARKLVPLSVLDKNLSPSLAKAN